VVAQPIRPLKLKEYKKGWDINAHKEMTNAFENLGGKLIDIYIYARAANLILEALAAWIWTSCFWLRTGSDDRPSSTV